MIIIPHYKMMNVCICMFDIQGCKKQSILLRKYIRYYYMDSFNHYECCVYHKHPDTSCKYYHCKFYNCTRCSSCHCPSNKPCKNIYSNVDGLISFKAINCKYYHVHGPLFLY